MPRCNLRRLRLTGLFNKYTFHLGLIGPLIGIHALSRLKRETGFIVIPAAVLFSAAVGQIFNIFPFTLIDRLPFFSFVQNDYWPCMAALSLMVLAAFGYDAISKTNAFTYPCALLVGLISVSFAFPIWVSGFTRTFRDGYRSAD